MLPLFKNEWSQLALQLVAEMLTGITWGVMQSITKFTSPGTWWWHENTDTCACVQ